MDPNLASSPEKMHNSSKKRIFILAEREFPSGNAGGTRVRYLAKMYQEIGYSVFVISLGQNKAEDLDPQFGGYHCDGVQYFNAPIGVGPRRFVDRYLLSGLRALRILRMQGKPRPRDTIIIYSTNAIYCFVVLIAVRKTYRVWMDIVEWFQSDNFRLGRWDPKFWLFQVCFQLIYPSSGRVIAISETIQRHFAELGCKTIVIPCLYETDLGANSPRSPQLQERIRLIYSGNPALKESLAVMLEALVALPEVTRERFEMHFTGVSAKKLSVLLGERAHLLCDFGNNLIVHPWMTYDALLDLYRRMNFLYFIREARSLNLANFPMKLPELMSIGVVPLTTRVGDYGTYLADGENSIISAGADVDSCVEALMRLASMSPDEFQTMSEGAIRTVREHFDYRMFARKNRQKWEALNG